MEHLGWLKGNRFTDRIMRGRPGLVLVENSIRREECDRWFMDIATDPIEQAKKTKSPGKVRVVCCDTSSMEAAVDALSDLEISTADDVEISLQVVHTGFDKVDAVNEPDLKVLIILGIHLSQLNVESTQDYLSFLRTQAVTDDRITFIHVDRKGDQAGDQLVTRIAQQCDAVIELMYNGNGTPMGVVHKARGYQHVGESTYLFEDAID